MTSNNVTGRNSRTGTDVYPAHGYVQNSDRKECSICSPYSTIPIFHPHFSSLFLRQITGVEFSGARQLCCSCMSHHVPYPEERNKIVLSDSTIHQFFSPREVTNSQL